VDRLTSMTVFARVATARSFSAAARELGISQATASKHVQTLEGALGARLLNRTTRRVALTEAGISFYAQCQRILEDMETAWQAGQSAGALRGRLRIAAPTAFGEARLVPILGDFMQAYRGLSLTVTLTDDFVDVVEERWDLAIRIGRCAPDMRGLAVHHLMVLRLVLCAAPAYLEAAGHPGRPADLGRLNCVLHDDPRAEAVWRFKGPDGVVDEVAVNGSLRTNSTVMRREAARSGAGLCLAPEFLVADDLASGRLVRVLPDYMPDVLRVDAVCPEERMVSPRLDRLIAFLAEKLAA
jgi:DNA-binding transcriptional LysR family regulator